MDFTSEISYLFVCIILQKTDRKAYTPRFPKPKDEGWFLIIGNVDARELVALKRVPCIRGNA
jgi:activating signal cointegrator complex subunit 3